MKTNTKSELYKTDLKPAPLLLNPTRETIINQIYSREDFKVVIEKVVCKHKYKQSENKKYLQEELFSDILLHLCNMNVERLLMLYSKKELDIYILGLIDKKFNRERSDFNRSIKSPILNKVSSHLGDLPDIAETSDRHTLLDHLDTALDKLKPHERNAIKLKFEHRFINKIAKHLKISRNYTGRIIKESEKQIENIINSEIQKSL